jgi:hypothetical protein
LVVEIYVVLSQEVDRDLRVMVHVVVEVLAFVPTGAVG